MVDLLETHANLVLGAETGGARFRTGAYQFWRAHVRTLLTESAVTEPESLVDVLLAPLAAEVYQYQREHGLTPAQINAALQKLADGVISCATGSSD